jgi:NAD(P)-dependent dehydrogenase (short-subunit alcohol dehydrogenase family)
MEGLRQESTDGAVRTTSISPGFVDTELDSSIDDVALREQIRRTMNAFGIPPDRPGLVLTFRAAIDRLGDLSWVIFLKKMLGGQLD